MAIRQLNVLSSSFPVLSIPLFFCPVAAVTSSAYIFFSTIVASLRLSSDGRGTSLSNVEGPLHLTRP